MFKNSSFYFYYSYYLFGAFNVPDFCVAPLRKVTSFTFFVTLGGACQ